MSEKTTVDRLVYMANQISDFFKSQGHGEESHPARVAGVADHIRAFWDPRMRAMIYAHIDEKDGEGLRPLAKEAIQALKVSAPASSQTVHAAAVAAGASERGGPAPGDDAG